VCLTLQLVQLVQIQLLRLQLEHFAHLHKLLVYGRLRPK
jgi:hypothetical protein